MIGYARAINIPKYPGGGGGGGEGYPCYIPSLESSQDSPKYPRRLGCSRKGNGSAGHPSG